ncbi:chromate efflux transporter [Bacillus taeanensis]|uniref:chromate efflux transporter n=1 Tax=Bacillus taeanensis TaxID=273032 RepID=UPI001FE9B2F4|nr:chromate efflux transporter [Bacillus taeanensis]
MEKKSFNLKTLLEILLISTRLGLTSFGGPAAHLGYFRNEYIEKRKWLDDRSYADLVALCQFLPGPASSQVGIAIGMLRGGILGGVISWIGFTLPSVAALVLFAYFYQTFHLDGAGWIHGLKIVAVAVVAQAVVGMGQKLTPDLPRITIAVISAIFLLVWPTAFGQIVLIIASGIAGVILYKKAETPDVPSLHVSISRKIGLTAWGLFFSLLIILPLLRQVIENELFALFDIFYRVGSIVFGGGHVVLPLLEREVVPTSLISAEAFLAGYGAAQAVPGPLFTFAAYLGAMINSWQGALIAVLAIFFPSFLLIIGALPFWNTVRSHPRVQSALLGVNAAVVGILLAALYNPVFTSAVKTPVDFSLALAAFTLLVYWKLPPWAVVLAAAGAGSLFL